MNEILSRINGMLKSSPPQWAGIKSGGAPTRAENLIYK